MSTPYSGATPAGGQPGYGGPIDPSTGQPYAAGYGSNHAVSGQIGTPMTDDGHPDVEGTSVGALMGEVAEARFKSLCAAMKVEPVVV